MKNNILRTFLLCILVISCQSQENILRESVKFDIVTDSVFSRMPGTMIRTNDYLVWQDPFGIDGFIHIIDIATGNEIDAIGKIGQGPDEFNTPSICTSYFKNSVFVYDLNSPLQAYFFLDSLKENKNPYSRYIDNSQNRITSIINIDENEFIIYQPSETKRFKILNNSGVISFGNSIVNNSIENSYDVYQGAISFNNERKKLVFASLRFPYMEIYNTQKETPVLEFSTGLSNEAYTIEGKILKPETKRKGARDLALTKDYIVVIQRDYKSNNIDESTVGMDFNKLPTTIFLYDYNGNIKKIVDIGIPIFRIAGNIQDNTLYAIGVNPDFIIVKCEL